MVLLRGQTRYNAPSESSEMNHMSMAVRPHLLCIPPNRAGNVGVHQVNGPGVRLSGSACDRELGLMKFSVVKFVHF